MNPETPPQKLKDFQTELDALCKKYLYELHAVMALLPNSTGFVAELKVFDVSPKVDGVQLQPQVNADAPAAEAAPAPVETPATPEPEAPPLDNPQAN